jgi:hypothetical protein
MPIPHNIPNKIPIITLEKTVIKISNNNRLKISMKSYFGVFSRNFQISGNRKSRKFGVKN